MPRPVINQYPPLLLLLLLLLQEDLPILCMCGAKGVHLFLLLRVAEDQSAAGEGGGGVFSVSFVLAGASSSLDEG